MGRGRRIKEPDIYSSEESSDSSSESECSPTPRIKRKGTRRKKNRERHGDRDIAPNVGCLGEDFARMLGIQVGILPTPKPGRRRKNSHAYSSESESESEESSEESESESSEDSETTNDENTPRLRRRRRRSEHAAGERVDNRNPWQEDRLAHYDRPPLYQKNLNAHPQNRNEKNDAPPYASMYQHPIHPQPPPPAPYHPPQGAGNQTLDVRNMEYFDNFEDYTIKTCELGTHIPPEVPFSPHSNRSTPIRPPSVIRTKAKSGIKRALQSGLKRVQSNFTTAPRRSPAMGRNMPRARSLPRERSGRNTNFRHSRNNDVINTRSHPAGRRKKNPEFEHPRMAAGRGRVAKERKEPPMTRQRRSQAPPGIRHSKSDPYKTKKRKGNEYRLTKSKSYPIEDFRRKHTSPKHVSRPPVQHTMLTPSKKKTFEVVVPPGALTFNLGAADDKKLGPVVTWIHPESQDGISMGDHVIRVNGRCTENMPLVAVVKLLEKNKSKSRMISFSRVEK